jgi:hypothetical protein
VELGQASETGLCAVLQVVQCSASVISEYYCQLLPELLDIVDWWLVLPSGFGYYFSYSYLEFLVYCAGT